MYVQESAEKQLNNMVAMVSNPKQGDLLVSAPCLMETCAWYVGTVCAEYDEDMGWMYMPYERLTQYAENKEQAQMWLDAMQDFYE